METTHFSSLASAATLNDCGVIVTGGSKGIGKEIVFSLAKHGCAVAFCSRSLEENNNVAQEASRLYPTAKIVPYVCDVSDPESVCSFVKYANSELGEVRVLVNNAGIGIFNTFDGITVTDWSNTYNTDLNGAFYASKEVIPLLLQNKGDPKGIVVNIGSLSANEYVPGNIAYASAKAALEIFSHYLMNEYRRQQIRVVHISIGSVDTSFSTRHVDNTGWKIAPQEIGTVVANIVLLELSLRRSVISDLVVRTSSPIDTLAWKE